MTVSLSKGGNVSLSKEAPGLEKVIVGLGWDARETEGKDFDLDASVFVCGENDKVRSDADFVFYNNMTGANGAVEHQGDNRTGEGEGDDEQVKIDLASVPADVHKLAFAVTIHEAASRGQNFGMVRNAFIRVVNAADDKELARYDLSEDYSNEAAMLFGEVYRHGDDWKFKAIGQGYSGELGTVASHFGVNVG